MDSFVSLQLVSFHHKDNQSSSGAGKSFEQRLKTHAGESFAMNQVNGKDSSSPLQDHHAAFRNIMHARKMFFLLIA